MKKHCYCIGSFLEARQPPIHHFTLAKPQRLCQLQHTRDKVLCSFQSCFRKGNSISVGDAIVFLNSYHVRKGNTMQRHHSMSRISTHVLFFFWSQFLFSLLAKPLAPCSHPCGDPVILGWSLITVWTVLFSKCHFFHSVLPHERLASILTSFIWIFLMLLVCLWFSLFNVVILHRYF